MPPAPASAPSSLPPAAAEPLGESAFAGVLVDPESIAIIRPGRIISIGTPSDDRLPPEEPPPPLPPEPRTAAAPPAVMPFAVAQPGTSPADRTPFPPAPQAIPGVGLPPPAAPAADFVDTLEEIEPEASAPESEREPDHRSTAVSFEEIEVPDDDDDDEEIAVEDDSLPAEQPRRPPPPPPRRAPAPTVPDLGTASASRPRTPPEPVAAVPPAEPRKRKPWWEELFGEDYIRTLDDLPRAELAREVDFIEERLGLEKGAVVLDLACGTGVHAVELASRGYSVVGYDLSLAMLARAADTAQERGQKLNFLQGDMREMAFEETFDGVYCWATSFGYFEDDRNQNILSRMHRALRQGGMLLLDVANRDHIAQHQPSMAWFKGDGCTCMDEMHLDFFTNRMKVKRMVLFDDGRASEIEYSIRLYGLNELGKLLRDTGFKVVEVTGHLAYPGAYFGVESPRTIVLAERI